MNNGTSVREGISRVHDLEGGNVSKEFPLCPRVARAAGASEVTTRLVRCEGGCSAGGPGRGRPRRRGAQRLALPNTLLPGSALLPAKRGRCHSYRHSQERRGRAREYVIPSATLLRASRLFRVRDPRPASPALQLRASPARALPRSAPARCPPGRAGEPARRMRGAGPAAGLVSPPPPLLPLPPPCRQVWERRS